MSVTGTWRCSLKTGAPCHCRCGTLKNHNWSMTLGVEHRSIFSSLHRQWWCLTMSEKVTRGTKKSQVIKQEKKNFPFIENQCWLRRSRVIFGFVDLISNVIRSGNIYYHILVNYIYLIYSDLVQNNTLNRMNALDFFFTRLTRTLRWYQS